MSSEIVPAPDDSQSSSSSSSSSVNETTTDYEDQDPPRMASDPVRRTRRPPPKLDSLDLRAVGNPNFKSHLTGGDYHIAQFLSSAKGHRHVTQLNPTPNSVNSLLHNIKEPSVLLLQGCNRLFADPAVQFPFHQFKTLTTLEISRCAHLTTLPEQSISRMTHLQTLNLSHLPLQHLPPDLFSNLTNLRSLVLRACPNLCSLPEFPRLPSLQCLELSHLLIQSLPRYFFENFPSLRWVILRGCSNLHSFPFTARLQSLEVLDVSHCTSLKELDHLLWHPKLQMLDLSHTALHRVPIIREPSCLTHLFLRDTHVTGSYYLKFVTTLQVLDLSGSRNVRRIDRVQANKDLVSLDLSDTGIESIDLVSDLIHLRHLILRECICLVKLPALKRLTSLEVLDVSGCETLDDLPDDLSCLAKLKELSLCGCSRLKELREGLFDHMTGLEKLDLAHTNVNHLPSVASLGNLGTLSLRGLELDSLEALASLSSLVELDLKGVSIRPLQELSFGFLELLDNLQTLNLSQTSVAKLPEMSKLVNLKELLLANCPELKDLSQLQTLKNLEVLDLSLPDDCTETEAQSVAFLSAPDSLRKLLLANRPGVLKLFPSELLAKLECLDLHGTDETCPVGVKFSRMENLQEVVSWDGNHIHRERLLQGKISSHDELHLVSTFMSNSGFERFKYEFSKVEDLILNILKNFKSDDTTIEDTSRNSVANTAFAEKNQAMKMLTDLRYILENIDLLESSRNVKSSEGLLNELMDAAIHLSSDDFPLDSSNLTEIHRVIVKLKLLVPPKKVEGLEITEEVKKKNKPRFTRIKNKEKVVINDGKDFQENMDLLSLYESLNSTEKNCLLCFSVFPCGQGLDEGTGASKSLAIKKRILIHWWFGEGFIGLQHEKNPKLKTVEEAGKQILKVLEEKGFIEVAITKRRESGSCRMQPAVHSFVTARAKEEGFFDFHNKNGKLSRHCTRFQRARLLKSQDNALSSCNLWANYTSSKQLQNFKTIRTLINVNERMLYIKSEWFAKMKDLYVLHLGGWDFENEEQIEVVDWTFLEEFRNMNQLRLLSLQGFSTIIKFPDSICKLANLKMLNLRDCTYLQELPAGIGSLKNLTYFDLRHCPILSKFPKGMRLLSKLEVLKGFVITYQVGGQQHTDACTLRELSKLDNLRKLTLAVNKDKFPDAKDLQAFGEMKSLCSLEISWEHGYNTSHEPQDATGMETLRHSRWRNLKCWEQQMRENDAEELQKSSYLGNLQKLVLYCFPSEMAPDWLHPTKLRKLEKLYIVGGALETLPGDAEENAWDVKTLRLKYLRRLYTHWPRLRGMFPHMTYFEHYGCDNLTLFPPEVWVESDEK